MQAQIILDAVFGEKLSSERRELILLGWARANGWDEAGGQTAADFFVKDLARRLYEAAVYTACETASTAAKETAREQVFTALPQARDTLERAVAEPIEKEAGTK
jgi:hypothetical protein